RSLPEKIAYEALRQLWLPPSDEEPLRVDLSFMEYPPLPTTIVYAAEMTAADQPSVLRSAPFAGAFPALLAAAERSGNLEPLIDPLRARQVACGEQSDVALALALDHAGQEMPIELLEKITEQILKRLPAEMGSKEVPSLGHLAVAVSAAHREA